MKNLLLFGALAFCLNSFGQVPAYVSTNGLVGWWPFNGTANDESGNDLNNFERIFEGKKSATFPFLYL